MKIPSLSSLFLSLTKVFRRFPLQVLVAFMATAAWCYAAQHGTSQYVEETTVKFVAICNIALVLLIAVDLFVESRNLSVVIHTLLRCGVVVLAAVLFYNLDPFAEVNDIFKIGLIVFAGHLLVAFAPFINRGTLSGFWQYNKILFLHILTSFFYAGVLFAGLAIALFAIDSLFNANVKDTAYIWLFAIISVSFSTIFFLAGLPQNVENLTGTAKNDEQYPKALKVFTQYVLIPLMSIYLLILLVYEAKIILNWQLPKGLVSTLILGYAVFGILSLLLVYPIRDKEGNGWIKLFSKFFYIMMIPLIVLLILAVGKRVSSYGITESRYILMVLATWLTGITIYFLFNKKQNIKVIPISLCIIAVLAAFGPQSAFSVARASQTARLNRLINSNSLAAKREIPSVVRYLVERHGIISLQTFTEVDLAAVKKTVLAKADEKYKSKYNINSQLVDSAFSILKIKDRGYIDDTKEISFNYEAESENLISVKGYDALLNFSSYNSESATGNLDGKKLELKFNLGSTDKNNDEISVLINGKPETKFSITNFVQSIFAKYSLEAQTANAHSSLIPLSFMQISKQSSVYTFTFVAKRINGIYDEDKKTFTRLNYEGYLLIKKN